MTKFHLKYFIESISYEDVNPDQIRNVNHKFRNIHSIQNKLTQFQIYPETELACKYNKPIYKTQYSEILVEYENGFEMNTGNLIVHSMAITRSFTDENSYVLVNLRQQNELGENKTTRYRKYTITRTITYVQHTFWRNSL